MVKNCLCGITPDELDGLMISDNYDSGMSVRILKKLYKKRPAAISDITNVSKKLKDILTEIACTGILYPVSTQVSDDKTKKYLFRTEDGKEFETVFIPDKKRKTICVSTQSGCKMGCRFCVTARYGFRGNLSSREILSQIIGIPEAEGITHIVFMGMGEPMDNLDNVLKACEIITAEWGLSISRRNVTVSTVGITPGVRRFLETSDCNLTLSLHSPFGDERQENIPVEKVYPVNEIINLMKNFTVRNKRRLSISYIMLNELNDTDRHLNALIELFKGSVIRINLLPYHQSGDENFEPSTSERMDYFKHKLVESGISASIRKSRGEDITAACGLLASGLN